MTQFVSDLESTQYTLYQVKVKMINNMKLIRILTETIVKKLKLFTVAVTVT